MEDANVFDASICDVVKLPRIRHDLSYWSKISNRSDEKSSKKRRINEIDLDEDTTLQTRAPKRPSNMLAGADTSESSSDDESIPACDSATMPIRRSPSNSINSMKSAASTQFNCSRWSVPDDSRRKQYEKDTTCNSVGRLAFPQPAPRTSRPSASSSSTSRAPHRKAPKQRTGDHQPHWVTQERGYIEATDPQDALRPNMYA
jgi:hypothetical protein